MTAFCDCIEQLLEYGNRFQSASSAIDMQHMICQKVAYICKRLP